MAISVANQDDMPSSGHSAPTAARTHSLLSYSPPLILFAIMVADSGRWADPDLWGHVRFGQAVLAHRHLVMHDPYSYSAPGHLWLNHEWLSEVLMAWLYNTAGILGLKLAKFACASLTVFFLAAAMSETGATATAQFALLAVAAASIAPQVQFRPQVFTFASSSALLALLARHNFRGRAPLWLAIPLLALWANLHGGFILGLAMLGIYSTVSLLQDLLAHRGPRRSCALLALTACATGATMLTPYGIGTWQAVLHALGNLCTS